MESKIRTKILIVLSVLFLCTATALVVYVGVNNIKFKIDSDKDTEITEPKKEEEGSKEEDSKPTIAKENLTATELEEFKNLFNTIPTNALIIYAEYSDLNTFEIDSSNMGNVYNRFKNINLSQTGAYYTTDVTNFILEFKNLTGRTLTETDVQNSKLWDDTLNAVKLLGPTNDVLLQIIIDSSSKEDTKYTFEITIEMTLKKKKIELTKNVDGTYTFDSIMSI